MEKYRNIKKYVLAVCWKGDNLREVIDMIGRHDSLAHLSWSKYEEYVKKNGLKVFAPGGSAIVKIGEWLIVEEVGYDVHICSPEYFAETYRKFD